MSLLARFLKLPLIGPVLRHRFTKFGLVGFSGTIVNLVVLYLAQEVLLRAVRPEDKRLSCALALAIFFSTLNNFWWNRHWTWRERKEVARHGVIVQLGQYFLASWLSIVLQFVLTKVLAALVHYLIANVLAIVTAALVTYLLNDVWTFGPADRRPGRGEAGGGRSRGGALRRALQPTPSEAQRRHP